MHLAPGLCLLLSTALAFANDAPTQPLVAHVQAHRDGRAPWSIDFSRFDDSPSALPIGVFDSGIGGLTVLEAILRLDAFNNDTLQPGADGRPDFAGERFIYFGDQANMPYGNLAAAFAQARTHRTADGTQPYAAAAAADIRFTDPAEATARELFRELARTRLRHKTETTPPASTFYFSVPDPKSPGIQLSPDGALDASYKLSRSSGRFDREDTSAIPLTSETIPAAMRPLVQSLPATWREMQKGR